MTYDARWETRLGAWMMVGCMLSALGCSDDDGGGGDGGSGSSSGSSGGSGQTTFSCGKAGEFCLEYAGSASNIDAIRTSTKCADQGAVEGTGCVKEGAAVCELPQNGGTGTRGAQYFYTFDEDDLTTLKATCERNGGTFSAP